MTTNTNPSKPAHSVAEGDVIATSAGPLFVAAIVNDDLGEIIFVDHDGTVAVYGDNDIVALVAAESDAPKAPARVAAHVEGDRLVLSIRVTDAVSLARKLARGSRPDSTLTPAVLSAIKAALGL